MSIKSLITTNRSLILYLAIGFSGFIIDMVLFSILFRVFHVSPYWANPISTTIGIINNFLLNAFYNFKRVDRLFFRFLLFYSVGIVGIIVGDIILWIFTDFWGIQIKSFLIYFSPVLEKYNVEIVKFASLFLIACMQYLLNKKISFRENSKQT